MRTKSIDFIFILSVLSLIFFYFNKFELNVDSTWILHCAKMMTEGSTLYKDMIDVNPPLIFLYSTVAIFISKFFNFTIITSYILLVIFLIGFAIILSWQIVKNIPFSTKEKSRYFIYMIILILSISVSYNFGEREHLFIIFTFPYILLMMYKNHNENTILLIKILIGCFASLGFNLKPHFFLIFFIIEIVYIFDKKNIFKLFRIESIIIVLSAISYLYIIYVYFPEYLNFMIPLAIDTYTDLFKKNYFTLLINYEIIFSFSLFIFFIFLTKNKFTLSNKTVLFSIFCSLIIYLLQQKGWSYHRLPLLTLSLLFFTHLIINEQNKKTIYFILLVPMIFIIPYYNVINVYHYNSLKKILKKLPSKSTILIVSMDIAQGQPLLQKEQKWASRFPSNFMIPSIIKNPEGNIEKYTFDAIFEDLNKYKPHYIIFPKKELGFDYFDLYTAKDKRLKEFYKKYYRISFKSNYIILTKQKEL